MNPTRSRGALAVFAFASVLAFLAFIPGAPAEDPKEQPKSPASSARPIPVKEFQIPWMGMTISAMNAESNRPDLLGRPTVQPSDVRYYYLPLFANQKDDKGELDMKVTDEEEVTLSLVYDSEEARHAVRDYLVDKKLVSADLTVGQVMIVGAKACFLETSPRYEPHVWFDLPAHGSYQFGATGHVNTRLSPDEARKFERDLKDGKVDLQATIAFDG